MNHRRRPRMRMTLACSFVCARFHSLFCSVAAPSVALRRVCLLLLCLSCFGLYCVAAMLLLLLLVVVSADRQAANWRLAARDD